MNSNAAIAAFLNPDEIQDVQARLLNMLSEEILRYTGYESNSVPVETAQSLFESMLYCMTAYLNTLPDPYAALRALDLQQIFFSGLELVRQYVTECRQLLKKVKATRVQTELIAYNHTVDSEISLLLKGYDPRFQAQKTTELSAMANISYPLFSDDLSVTGILYIRNYLLELLEENEFCAGYGKNYIRSLLLTHGVRHRLDYREMLVNIKELILEQK
ncbi:DUF6179 domain-containing protein [Caproiciproducens sp. CPB-2]|uniref:DUF6179 domain-containing protein n=1 Tax=Caproiciproducens sp. CPB-2 TaxID=3030017 RepID=UPI0023DCE37C|nr:DUF6179 domain-containing protein [Caproiciproducens sp. CPB-2]MDF1494408.1 DUF6179 domain-containing protein [Caproiciproducens sp. CPB-2]